MVRRILSLLHTEVSGLHEAAFLLAIFAFAAKILALVRDRLLVDMFGASATLDIYYAAFRIPDFIYASLGTLVASAVLIPFIVSKLEKGEEVLRFFSNIFTAFFFVTISASTVVFFFMPALSTLIVPGLSSAAQETLVTLSRIMLLSPILLGLSGLFASVTQSLRRFYVYALAPILYNVGILGGIVFLYPLYGLSGLAYGVVLGALLHVGVQIPVLARNNFLPRFVFPIRWGEIKHVLTLSIPRTIALSAHDITILILVALASFMAEGSITVFNLSFNLQSVPLSIIGVSYSIAAFPTLARLFSNGDRLTFVSHIISAARHIIFWTLPVLVLFIVLRAQIVRTILGTGEFDWADTRLTAAALALFVVSAASQSLILLFVRGYYAAGRTLKPLFINIGSLLFIVACAFMFNTIFETSALFRYFLESLLRIEYLPGSKVLILPLAFSIGAFLNIVLLWYFFKKDFEVSFRELACTLRQSFLASVIAGFVTHQSLRVADNIVDINTFFGIFSQGLVSGIVGVAAGIIVLKLIRNKEIEDIQKTLTHKFWKTKPIAPDQGDLVGH